MRPTADGWRLETTEGPIAAREVVVATGPFARPHYPPVAAALPPGLVSIHSHEYRNESGLPDGGVLVVGSGQTGVQLAAELRERGRDVSLSVGRTPRAPRRYRGRDLFAWMRQLVDRGPQVGVALPAAAELPDPSMRVASSAQLSGHRGGYSPDLRALARDGVRLLGRLSSVHGTQLRFDADLAANLVHAETAFAQTVQPLLDAFIAASGIEVPAAEPFDSVPFEPATVDSVDVRADDIRTAIWATGYRPDYGWIDADVTDAWGLPVQHDGVSVAPGLSFLGGLWQHDSTSSTLVGLARDARLLAEQWSSPAVRRDCS